jgi:succinate dehydrogenase / fumarate reductase flavoprotein subunit
MMWPPGARGILVTEAVRGEGGLLFNSEHQRFMLEYDPKKKELSSRDVVARSIYKEVQAGRGTPHGGAFLDITHKGSAYIRSKLPSMYEQFHSLASVDITREAMEVGPTIHYTMGGIRVEAETAATRVPGLYAAGESAGGLHGANRLGGNSLGDILVFGRRAGLHAAEYAKSRSAAMLDAQEIGAEQAALLEPLTVGPAGENPYHLHEDLQEAMQDDAGIARTEESLTRSLDAIQALRERSRTMGVTGSRVLNPGWHTCRDVTFMLTVSEAIVRSALARRESRGSQWRLDHLEKNGEQGEVNYVVRKLDGAMEVAPVPVEPLPADRLALLTRSRFFDPANLGPQYGEFAGTAMPAPSSAPVGEEQKP